MKNYIEWLERQVENTLEDKDLHREHWAFCQALKKYRELTLNKSSLSKSFCSCEKPQYNYPEMTWCDNCSLEIKD